MSLSADYRGGQFFADPRLGVIPFPKVRGTKNWPDGRRLTFTHNSRGLRSNYEFEERKTDAYRILMLGDSYTYGLNVNDNETFSHYLQTAYNNKKLNVQVINAGNPGKGTDYAVKFFRFLGNKYHPNLVMLWVFHNDFYDNARGDYYFVDSAGQLYEKPAFVTGVDRFRNTSIYGWFMSWSHLANFLKGAIVKIWQILRPTKRLYAAMPIYLRTSLTAEQYRLTAIYISKLRDAVISSGGALIICYIPDMLELNHFLNTGECYEYELATARIAHDKGLEFLSFTQIFSQYRGDHTRLFNSFDVHFSPHGNRFVATYLEKYLHERVEGVGSR